MNLAAYRKAIAAVLTTAVAYVVLKLGLDVDADTTAVIVTALTGLVVSQIPNEAL
ncbi:MAG: hypothetical protein H0U55_11715 [Rubrobacteraceae bacterium]|nr:hypothetical protein [Rubrobacteraceae bacterium]